MGHDKERLETASYGTDRSQLELRKAVIEAIDYPGVAFESISWKEFRNIKKSTAVAKKQGKPLPPLDI